MYKPNCETRDPLECGREPAQSKLAAVRSILSAKSKYLSVPLLVLCTSLTGCGTILGALTGGKADSSVSAEDIDLVKDKLPLPDLNASRPEKLEYLGKVASVSEQKCGVFLNGLVLGENTTNTTLDVASTAFSALSTAFTPPGTKTALSAAASIASGSKTAIDTDIYAKAAIADFSTAIQKTYSTQMQTYTTNLPKLLDTSAPLIVSNEVAKIQAIHALCGLAPAESSLQAKLGTTDGYTLPTPPPNGAGSPPAGSGPTPVPQHPFFWIPSNPQTPTGATQAPVWGAPW